MLKFDDILVIFGTILTLGFSGFGLKKIEHFMRDQAIAARKSGYISISGYQRQLDRGH